MNEAQVTASYLKRKFRDDPRMREVIDFIESSRSKGYMHGIVTGGIVTWISGLTFSVCETVYYILNMLCKTAGLVTLSPADPDLPRIDLIVINSDWEVKVIEGIPAENPLQPTPDPQTQLALTYVLIPAAANEPANITEIIVFNEHVAGEFTSSASGVAVDFDYATIQYLGTKCASVGAIGNNDTILFTGSEPKMVADYESLSLFLKLKAAASKSHALYVQFRLAGIAVSNEMALAFNITDTVNWQNISILLSAFTFSNAQFDAIRLRWSKTGTQSDFAGFYLDYIKLQKGIAQPTFVDTVELTGDVTGKGKTGTPFAALLQTVNSNVGTFGSETKVPQITVDAKGRVTSVSEKTITSEIIVAQPAHSFIFGNTIKRDGVGNWIKSQANTRANAGTVGIVSRVIDADHFAYITGGLLPGDFVDGASYFLSPDWPGEMYIVTDETLLIVGQVYEFIGTGTPAGLEVEIDVGFVITEAMEQARMLHDIAFDFNDITAGISQAYTLDIKVSFPYKIISACLETDDGTLDGVQVRIGINPVEGLSNITIDTTVDEILATGLNDAVPNDRVWIVTSTAYTGAPTKMEGKLKIARI